MVDGSCYKRLLWKFLLLLLAGVLSLVGVVVLERSLGGRPMTETISDHAAKTKTKVVDRSELLEHLELLNDTSIPCNIIGVSNVPRPPSRLQPHSYQQRINTFVIGQSGNNLFQFATYVSSAIDKGMRLEYPLRLRRTKRGYIPFKEANKRDIEMFPRLAELMVEDDMEQKGPIERWVRKLVFYFWNQKIRNSFPFYQTAYWVDQFAQHRSELCYYLSMSFHPQQLPKPNDIVIHFRDFSVGNSQPPFLFNIYQGQYRLSIPPTIYYNRILESSHYETIWLVGEAKLQNHPMIQHILQKYAGQARWKEGGSATEDFQFISFASHIVLSPSTYGWWAAFFAAAAGITTTTTTTEAIRGEDDDNVMTTTTTIHYPIMPLPVPMPWCEVAGGFRDSGATVLFHDWYRNTTIVGDHDDNTWQTICNHHQQQPSLEELQSVAAFYSSELDLHPLEILDESRNASTRRLP